MSKCASRLFWCDRLPGTFRNGEACVVEGYTTALFVLKGRLELSGDKQVGEAELAVLSRDEQCFSFKTLQDVTLIVLSGKPLDEPIVGYGPFVMTTEAEIHQAFADYRSGRMGKLG